MKFLFIHARVHWNTLTSKGRMNLNGLLSTSTASAIPAAEKMPEERKHQNESNPRLNEHI